MGAAATLYLVPRAIDRLALGRRLAAPFLGGTQDDSDVAHALRGTHPDLIDLVPPEKKERIGIDQVREVIRLAQFSPVRAGRKVCLVPRAEALTPEAANALLKIMEEPPRDAAFVLLAEHPSDLLPTILSRCRTVRLPPLERGAVERRLVDAGYAARDAAWLARIALRDGDLDRLAAEPVDVGTTRHAAAAELRTADITELVSSAFADDPIRRQEALLLIGDRVAAQDADLLTVGVRTLAGQDRDALARFLQELLVACFEPIHAASGASADADRAPRDPHPATLRLEQLCRSIDVAARSLAAYGPPDAVLLSLMLMPGDDADAD